MATHKIEQAIHDGNDEENKEDAHTLKPYVQRIEPPLAQLRPFQIQTFRKHQPSPSNISIQHNFTINVNAVV